MSDQQAYTLIDLVQEYFPDVSDQEAIHILWEYTGFPGFWIGDPEESLRKQLQRLKDVGPEQIDRERDEAFLVNG